MCFRKTWTSQHLGRLSENDLEAVVGIDSYMQVLNVWTHMRNTNINLAEASRSIKYELSICRFKHSSLFSWQLAIIVVRWCIFLSDKIWSSNKPKLKLFQVCCQARRTMINPSDCVDKKETYNFSYDNAIFKYKTSWRTMVSVSNKEQKSLICKA